MQERLQNENKPRCLTAAVKLQRRTTKKGGGRRKSKERRMKKKLEKGTRMKERRTGKKTKVDGRKNKEEEMKKRKKTKKKKKKLWGSIWWILPSGAATSCVLARYRNICQETMNYVGGNVIMPETTLWFSRTMFLLQLSSILFFKDLNFVI